MDIEEKILETLRENREGVMITEIAEHINVHRHTAIKYLYKLMGEGKIKIKKIGIAKLCYLNEQQEEKEQTPIFQLLPQKSKLIGKVPAKFIILLFILLIITSQGIIFAQNLDLINTTNNASIQPPEPEKQENETYRENTTITTIATTTIPETTSSTETTIEETTTASTVPVAVSLEENLDLFLVYPGKVTRGEEISIAATASALEADNFMLSVQLPDYMELVSGMQSVHCEINATESCSIEFTARILPDAVLGKNEIMVIAMRG